jgi:hypothetical protein
MSRTYKDRPHWVKVRDPAMPTVESHHHHGTHWRTARRREEPVVCDLADFDAARDRTASWRLLTYCIRKFPWNKRCYYHSPVPDMRGWVHAVWSGPERSRERVGLRGAAREYNSHGEAEDFDFPNHQHRHSARWLCD